ncbi:MAG: hypothetical protein ACPG5T_08695, partial [Endozoicomonas sp.]
DQPKDIHDEPIEELNPVGGTLSVDDSVLDKPYSDSVDLVGYFWPGKHHRAVKAINLVTLYNTDRSGRHMPVNFRIGDKSESKTKNDYFREMLIEVLSWGLETAGEWLQVHSLDRSDDGLDVWLKDFGIAQEFTKICQHQRALFKETVGPFVEAFSATKENLLPKITGAING